MSGKDEAKNSGKGTQREEANKNFWRDRAEPLEVGMRDFQMTLNRGMEHPNLDLGPMVTGFSWSDTGPILQGDLSLILPRPKDGTQTERPDIRQGDLVTCRVSGPRGGSGLQGVWKMRVESPAWSLADGSFSCTLQDDLARLQKSTDDFIYKKGDGHKNGWKAHQIVEDICRRYGVETGQIKKGKHSFKKLVKRNASPLDVMQEVYQEERYKEGARAIIRFREGKLEIVPMKRSRFLLKLGKTLTSATLTGLEQSKDFATRYEVSATSDTEKGKRDKKKIEVTVTSEELRSRFGLIVKSITLDEVNSQAEARQQAMRMMVEAAKIKRDVIVTHPGVPSVFRGDAISLKLPYEGLRRKILYIKEVRHSVGPGSYDMELTLSFDDPFLNAKLEAQCEKRCKKAAEKGRKPPEECDCPKQSKPKDKPPKNGNRGNHDNQPGKARKGSL